MKIYVINMERSVQRRKSMEDHLRDRNLPYEIIKAVDGTTLSDTDVPPAPEGEEPFTKSEIGCMKSHLGIYRLMQERPEEFALILEDDILITEPAIADVLDQLEQCASRETVTLLTYFGTRNRKVTLTRVKGNEILRGKAGDYSICEPEKVSSLTRAGAYLISKSCAAGILNYHTPLIRARADQWELYDRYGITKGLHCLYPMPISENYEHGSEINYTRSMPARLSKKFISWTIYNNIPLLSYIFKKRRQGFSGMYKNIVLKKQEQ